MVNRKRLSWDFSDLGFWVKRFSRIFGILGLNFFSVLPLWDFVPKEFDPIYETWQFCPLRSPNTWEQERDLSLVFYWQSKRMSYRQFLRNEKRGIHFMNFNEILRGVNCVLFMSSGKVHRPVFRNHQDGILVITLSGQNYSIVVEELIFICLKLYTSLGQLLYLIVMYMEW